MRLYQDEKDYLNKNYKIGERYEVVELTDFYDECDYLKVGLKGKLIEINDDGYFILDWDNGFNSHEEFPNWLQKDKIKIIN